MARPIRLLTTACSLLVAGSGCRPAPPPPAPPQAVVTAAVEHGGRSAGTRYSAHIEPASRVELAFKVGGYVESVTTMAGVNGARRLLQEGDQVTRGELLASLRRTDYEQQLAMARAAEGQAAAASAQAKLDLSRSEPLAATGSISSAAVDADRNRLASATASLAGAHARVSEAQLALADSALRAPAAGTVLRRAIEVGTLAAPGTVAFTLADLSSVKVVFAVPDTVLPLLHLGAPQTVTAEAYPGEPLRGAITRISPSADAKSRVFEAEVMLANGDGRLKDGMVAALVLGEGDARAREAPTPLVPLSAVVRNGGGGRDGGFGVFVVESDHERKVARARKVTLGEYLGRVIAVEDGLKDGDQVVVQGAGLLSDGEAVEVLPQ